MRASIINQYPKLDSTAKRLASLLNAFASYQTAQFRSLVAFASEAGLRIVEPSLRRFLEAGHSVFWIVGVDLGGTGRPALEFLYSLKRKYLKQVDARIFSTGDNKSIFHPKVYWLDSNDRKVVVIGSANATSGGLGGNFEASLVLDLEPLTDADILEELDFLWMTYTSPLPPLSAGNLIDLSRSLIDRFGLDHPPTDSRGNEPHPLGGLVPHRQKPLSTKVTAKRPGKELIMDILQETRQTQVQLPVDVLASFFRNADRVRLQQVRKGVAVKSDVRPIIHLGNNTHRIELDAIRGLPRPQIVRFFRTRHRSVVTYEIFLNGTREYDEAQKLLSQRGHQTRSGARRWLLK
jgi:HKD family nuclease